MIAGLALDTNAYRALSDGNNKLAATVQAEAQLSLPIIVIGELYHGIFSGKKAKQNLADLNHFLSSDRVTVLTIDEFTAKLFGEIATELRLSGKPMQQNDIWIAALCKQYNYQLATNDRGFDNVLGLEILNF